jgi:MFS family permease
MVSFDFRSFVSHVRTEFRLQRVADVVPLTYSFTAGAIVIAFSFSLGQLIAGRLILGIGVGGAAVICPLYITELAPTAVRGRCVGAK